MNSTSTPQLSVVIVLTGDTVEPCCETVDLAQTLEALARQADSPPMEVIVPYHSRVVGVDPLRARFPSVVFLASEVMRAPTGQGRSREHHDELRARGLAAARGDVVAFLEDHVRPDPSWSASVVAAHRRLPRHAGIGGAVENGVDRPLNWAAYFCDLGRYQNPVPAGDSAYVSAVNVSYKRAAMESIRSVWQGSFNETRVNRALARRGEKLALSPEIVVHQHRTGLRLGTALREFHVWGRSYARHRVDLMGSAGRAMLPVLSPLLPALLLLRLTAGVLRKRRSVAAFARAFPLIVLLTVSWSWGELAGYVGGAGQGADRRRLDKLAERGTGG